MTPSHVAVFLVLEILQTVLGNAVYTANRTDRAIYVEAAGCDICTGSFYVYRRGIVFESDVSTDQIVLNVFDMYWSTDSPTDCDSAIIQIYDLDEDYLYDQPLRTICQPDKMTIITTGNKAYIKYTYWAYEMRFRVNFKTQHKTDQTSGLSSRTKGLIAGGVIFALVVAGAAVFFCHKSKSKKRSTTGNTAPTSTSIGGNSTSTRVYPTTTNHAMTNNSTTYPPAITRLPPLDHPAYPPTSNNPAFPSIFNNPAYTTISNQQPYPQTPNNLGCPTPSNNSSIFPTHPVPEANATTPAAPPPPVLYNPEHLLQNNATKPPPPSYTDVMSQPQKY